MQGNLLNFAKKKAEKFNTPSHIKPISSQSQLNKEDTNIHKKSKSKSPKSRKSHSDSKQSTPIDKKRKQIIEDEEDQSELLIPTSNIKIDSNNNKILNKGKKINL